MNSNGIHLVHQAMVPVRGQASDAAEMVTQLLLGDLVEVLNHDRQWREIRALADDYEGWIDEKMILPVPEGWLAQVSHWEFIHAASVALTTTHNGAPSPLHVTYGCRVPVLQGQEHAENRLIQLDNWELRVPKSVSSPALSPTADHLLATSALYLGAPYLWGGKFLWGIDCSGYTQMVFARCGIQLPRDARQQALEGQEVAFGAHAPGDLAFFENKKGKVTHVGIILENNRVRHASGHVHDDLLTADGIWVESTQTLTHVLCSIKRIH